MTRKLAYWILGVAGATASAWAAVVVPDTWETIGKVPVLQAQYETVLTRLERIEDSLDLLLRIQLKRAAISGTIVVCKDDSGRVGACEEN